MFNFNTEKENGIKKIHMETYTHTPSLIHIQTTEFAHTYTHAHK